MKSLRLLRNSILISFLLLFAFSSAVYGASTASIEKTGRFKSQFVGVEAYLYNVLEKGKPSASNCEFKFKYTYKSGDTKNKVEACLMDRASYVLEYYMNDHMEDFNWATREYGIKNLKLYKTYATATLYYTPSPYYTSTTDKKVDKIVSGVINGLKTKSREKQVRGIYDWICKNATYNYSALSADATAKTNFYAHSQLGILLKGKGVCESYARVFQIFCDRLDIPCVIVSGRGHVWNYVKMKDGHWYLIDTTWADSGSEIDYSYFLVGNSPYLDTTHVPTNSIDYPKAWYISYKAGKNHAYHVSSITKATCTKSGKVTLTCSECQKKKTFTTEPLTHAYRRTDKSGSASAGYDYKYICKKCGKIRTDHYNPCSSHNWQVSDRLWSKDNSSCKIIISCSRCGTRLTASGKSNKTITQKATSLKEGKAVYSVVITGHALMNLGNGDCTYYINKAYSKKVTIPKKKLS